jgi:adenosine deaminase CECR1
MVGKRDMTLLGWKQLVGWSIEHACLSPSQRAHVVRRWEREWASFLDWVVDEFGAVLGES